MRRWVLLILLALSVTAVWIAREALLTSLGRLVVEENPLTSVEVGAIMSDPVPGAEEMAHLVHTGYVPHVVVLSSHTAEDEVLDRLHITAPRTRDMAVLVLRHLGVPSAAITIVHAADTGTNAQVRALTQYMRHRHFTRVTVIADRTHTRRIGRLLRARLGPDGLVVIHAATADPYRPEQWWRDRGSTRELFEESLRWFNSFVLRDWWRPLDTTP